MPQDKDKSPLAGGASYEKILNVPADKIKKRVRTSGSTDPNELLTSQDLFGDIIEDFSEEGLELEAPSPVEIPEPTEPIEPIETVPKTTDDTEAPAKPVLRDIKKEKIRSDTVPGEYNPDDSPSDYSLIDLAYSTLLQDERLNRTIEKMGADESGEEPADADVFGEYLLLDLIAMGGMAEVFQAKRKGVEGFEKIVAVKRILPHLSTNKGFVEMFIDEAKMVAGLSHPNIVQIFELGKIDDSYFIAMEFVDGMDLRTILTRVREKGIIPDVDLAALVASKLGSALEYAHRQCDAEGKPLRIVHRDVSPQNILISNEGEVKLVDFGIAKAAIKASHTDSGSLRGKLLYMSPEQAWGRAIDNRSDIFSLGVVLFEMLTGRTLFTGDSEMSILERVREARIIPPSTLNPAVPIELEAVVTRALRKDPEERYPDASEMLVHLDSYLRRRPAVGSGDLARFLRSHFEI